MMLLTAISTGMRVSEILALKWGRGRGTLLSRDDTGEPKTESSRRILALGNLLGLYSIRPTGTGGVLASGSGLRRRIGALKCGNCAGTKYVSWWTWTGSNRRPLPCHLRNINHLQASLAKTKDLAARIWTPFGRQERHFYGLDSTRTPGM